MSNRNNFGPYLLPNGRTTWKRFPMKDARRIKFTKRDLVNQSTTGQKVTVVTLDETVKLDAKSKKKKGFLPTVADLLNLKKMIVGIDLASGPDQTVEQSIDRSTGKIVFKIGESTHNA